MPETPLADRVSASDSAGWWGTVYNAPLQKWRARKQSCRALDASGPKYSAISAQARLPTGVPTPSWPYIPLALPFPFLCRTAHDS
eukprot:1153268-Pelagomonas_calceolata.AAC.1